MSFSDLKKKWNALVCHFNKYGIPVPTIRDPKTGLGSVSLTFVFITFNVWLASVIGKVAGVLGGMNPSDTLNMFLATMGLYLGRRIKIGDSTVDDKKEVADDKKEVIDDKKEER